MTLSDSERSKLPFWKRYTKWEREGIHGTPPLNSFSALVAAVAFVMMVVALHPPLLELDWWWYLVIADAFLAIPLLWLTWRRENDWYSLNATKFALAFQALIPMKLWPPLQTAPWWSYLVVMIVASVVPFAFAMRDLKKF